MNSLNVYLVASMYVLFLIYNFKLQAKFICVDDLFLKYFGAVFSSFIQHFFSS